MVRLKFYFPSLPAFPSWLQGRKERGTGKPPEAFGCGQEAAAVAKRDLAGGWGECGGKGKEKKGKEEWGEEEK